MWRSEGLEKSGKTLVMVAIAFCFGYGCGYNVFTNMTTLRYRGIPWATTITPDQFMRQTGEKDPSNWWIKDGFVLIDEAPTWFLQGAQGTSNVSQILQRGSVQLSKRNARLLMTSHLGDFLPNYVDNLTQTVFECKTDDGGKHIAFRAYDNQRRIECARNKIPWGNKDKAHWWLPGEPFFDLYDYEEGMDIFATDYSDFAGTSARRRRRAIESYGEEPTVQSYPTDPHEFEMLSRQVKTLTNLFTASQVSDPSRPTKADRIRARVGAD